MRGLRNFAGHHIDAPAVQQSRELALDTDEAEARNGRPGIPPARRRHCRGRNAPKDGAKQRQPRNVMSLAERRDRARSIETCGLMCSMILRASDAEAARSRGRRSPPAVLHLASLSSPFTLTGTAASRLPPVSDRASWESACQPSPLATAYAAPVRYLSRLRAPLAAKSRE